MSQARISLKPLSLPQDVVPRERLYPWAVPAVFLLTDLCSVSVAGATAVILRHGLSAGSAVNSLKFALLILSVSVGVFFAFGLYSGIVEDAISEFKTLIRANSVAYLIALGIAYLAKETAYQSRAIFLLGCLISMALLPLFRSVVRQWCCTQAWWATPTVIFGSGKAGQEIVEKLRQQPSLGLKPIAVLDYPAVLLPNLGQSQSRVFYGDLTLSRYFAAQYRNCLAIVAMPEMEADDLAAFVQEHADKFLRVWVVPTSAEVAALGMPFRLPAGGAGLELNQHHRRLVPQILKRLFDISIALPILVSLIPLFVVIAVLSRFGSPGPIFYGQRRVGRNGREFMAWKFRTMVLHADRVLEEHLLANPALREEWEINRKLKVDPRVTWTGKYLRKFSLDELPQLWNVVCGEMSVVGPRPVVRGEADKYGRRFVLYERVLPGITGLWQISGRNNTTYEERVRLDEYYVRHWSPLLDCYILLRTVKTVIFAEGAY
jgi:Undecaprenyl-phosphate galactose phosphotransferase WbaP